MNNSRPLCDQSYLIVINLFALHNPDTGQLLEHVQGRERPQVVDEYVGHPQVVQELQVNRGPHALSDSVVGGQSGLLPAHGEVHRQRHAKLLVVDLK